MCVSCAYVKLCDNLKDWQMDKERYEQIYKVGSSLGTLEARYDGDTELPNY